MITGLCATCDEDFEDWNLAIKHARTAKHRINRVKPPEDDPTSCFRCTPTFLVPPPLDNFFQHLADVHDISRATKGRGVT